MARRLNNVKDQTIPIPFPTYPQMCPTEDAACHPERIGEKVDTGWITLSTIRTRPPILRR